MNNKNEKKRVIHVLTDKNIGGAGRWLLYYLKYYNQLKYDVKVILPKDSLMVEEIKNIGGKTILIDSMEEHSFDKKSIQVFRKIFEIEKPHIVHTHASFAARVAAKKAHVKVVINTKHCMENSNGNKLKCMLKGFINKRYSTKITAVSEAVRQSMIEGGVSSSQVVTVYNGAELLNSLSEKEKKEIKLQYGIPENVVCVGIVARLEEVKDHDTFIRAAKSVLEKVNQVIFLIVGTGSLENELKQKVEELGISQKVFFTGFVKEVEMITGILDINVITSKQEALCLSIIEGMSMGIPAIGTNSGGVTEVIKEGYNGEIIAVGDWESLSNKILDFISNQQKILMYSENAVKTVKDKFLAKNIVAQIETVYESLS